jgi:hypothetical protein
MKAWMFWGIVLVLTPTLWAFGDHLVGMGDVGYWPKEVPSYLAGVVNGMAWAAWMWRCPI